jgi:phage repressor protein C with HTH and peptisase S24 domain
MGKVTTLPADRKDDRRAKPTPADLAAAGRLRAIWDRKKGSFGLTQDKMAEALDGSQGLVSQYLNGKIPLNYKTVLAFARALDVDPTEIRSDLPEQRLSPAAAADAGWLDVQGFAQAVGLGSGPEADEYAEAHKLKFRAESLSRKRLFARNLAVMYGTGDSMLPRIHPGDAILFDTSDTKPRDGAIFVVQVHGIAKAEYQAKRCMVLDEAVYFAADNPAGDHQWRKPRRMDAKRAPIEIIGRVRWIGSWED